jgi:membrane protein required for colicin V production
VNWVDTAVIAVAALSAMLAFARGLVRELFGVGAWVGALYFAFYAQVLVRDRIRQFVGGPELGDPLAYAAMFLPALIVLSIVTGTLGNAVRGSVLGSLDRTLGVAFGIARAGLLVAAAYVALGWLVPPESWPQPVRQARSTPYAHALAVWLVAYLPEQYRPNVAPPPAQRQTNSADLLHATPQGRAVARP